MPRSSRHRSHKHSKHSSKDYSDSEDDLRMKDKGTRDENLVKGSRDSVTGEKRKISTPAREGKDVKGPNGVASEECFSSKRRKEKTDIVDGGDRWHGGGEERGNGDRTVEKEKLKVDNSKSESKLKEISNKGESWRMERTNSKDKKYERGTAGEMESSTIVVEKEDSRSKGESKRKSEREHSGQKEGKEYNGKDRKPDKEKDKNLGQVSKRGDAKTNLVDMDVGKKQELQLGDLGVERKTKRRRENSDFPLKVELQDPEVNKEVDKKTRRRSESSSERGKHHDVFKEGDERGLSSRSDHAKDVKYKDDKPKDRIYVDKYHEDEQKDDGQRGEKYHVGMKIDNKHRDGKHNEDVGKDAKRREDRYRGDSDRYNRHKDEKNHEDGEKDGKGKDDKYQEGAGRRRDYRHREDSERENRHVDDRNRDDGEKKGRHGDVRHYENGDRDDRNLENNYRKDSHTDDITKEEKHQEDTERDSLYKDSKQADDFDREKRPREAKCSEELATRDFSGDKSDPRHSNDGGYAHHSKHSTTHDTIQMRDDGTVMYRDDQGRRRTTEKQDNSDVRSRSTKDQRFDSEKRSACEARVDSVPDRGRSTSKNADMELNSSHSRRRRSPSSSSLAPRDNYRLTKVDEYKHRECSYEERLRPSRTAGRDYAMGGSEKTSCWSLEKLGKQEDDHLRELSAERRLTSNIRSSPLKLVDKSPSSNTDREQFNRSDVRRTTDIEELTQRSGGSRDMNCHPRKEGRERHELVMDVLPRDEYSQADPDTISVSSPFTRNNYLSGSSKSFPPLPPLRAGADSPLMSGSIEDDIRFKSNSRHRRSIGDPNLGRIRGNPWRGVPSWPSTVPNGFMSFPHPPPPVGFHSVMHPFPAPAMFGIRPPMDSNHPTPYHIPDTDRFPGPVRPMGWHNPVDDSCNPLHSWDANNTVFQDEAHSYGRPGWDHSRTLPGGRGWDTTGDLWKGASNTACLEMPSYDKENDFSLTRDETLAGQSIQPTQNEQIFPDEQAAINDVNQSTYDSEINYVDAPINNFEDTSNLAKISKKDDVPLCHVYLSKLDISADLTEPELFNQCRGFIDMDQDVISDIDNLKILFIEEAIEAKVASHQILRSALSATVDDSVFQKAISLYESQKGSFDKVINGVKFPSANLPFTKSDHEDLDTEDKKPEKLSRTDDMQDGEDVLLHVNVESTPPNTSSDTERYTESAHQNLDLPPANTMVTSEEPVSITEHDDMMNLAPKILLKYQIIEERPLSVESIEGFHASSPTEVKTDGNIDNAKSGVTCNDTILNSDVCSEAMTPELVVSESIILSRIHHSPESTH
ncbi:zinc finger CCCH domain-containing protein 13 [Dorcoceras hygrometricum]|uniref:Zinc finger CCCH domain-containing protein 13 n=1 Tax=Dorcoceras hygrometricum TaxID=472368 RepID=A0A2Z7BHQ9_9LAMI|nr:zinc finger CCCH domain-containing protein 13 [Dorcoceras hygrometricum]